MNIFLKTASDINTIQPSEKRPGFNAGSKVGFDMFRFNSLMNDFRSDAANPARDISARKPVQNENYSHKPEEINKQSGTVDTRDTIQKDQSDYRTEKSNSTRENSEHASDIDNKRNTQKKNIADETSNSSKDQNASATAKDDQCSCGEEGYVQKAENAEYGQDKGQHIGLFLADILNSDAAALLPDNLLNDGKGSIVSEIAQLETEGDADGESKTGNLLSYLIKEKITGTITSGQQAGEPATDVEMDTDALIARMISAQSAKTEAGADAAGQDAVTGKLSVLDSGIQTDSPAGSLSEGSVKDSEKSLIENMMTARIKEAGTEAGNDTELVEDLSGQTDKKTDGSASNITETDKKTHIINNSIRHHMDRITDPAFKDIKNTENVISDRPVPQMAETIQIAAAQRPSTEPGIRAEGTSSESNNNGLLNNSNTSHESIKTAEGLKTAPSARHSAFNEVVDKIIYTVKGNTKLGVKVESETLGKLNINVSIEKGLVNVHINSADRAVREFVENNMQQIVASLSKNGVSVGGFSVGLRNNKNSGDGGIMNGGGRGSAFSVDRAKEREYINLASNVRHNSGMVNIFA